MSEDTSFFDLLDENENVDNDNEKTELPKVREFSPKRKEEFDNLLNGSIFFWVYNCYTKSTDMWKVESESAVREQVKEELKENVAKIQTDKKGRVIRGPIGRNEKPLDWYIDILVNYARKRTYGKESVENYIHNEAMRTVEEYNYTRFAKNLRRQKTILKLIAPRITILKIKNWSLNVDYEQTVDPKRLVMQMATKIAITLFGGRNLDGLSNALLLQYLPTLKNWERTMTEFLKQKSERTLKRMGKENINGNDISKSLANLGDTKKKIEKLISNVLKECQGEEDPYNLRKILSDYVVNYSDMTPGRFGFVAASWSELTSHYDVDDPNNKKKLVNFTEKEPMTTLRHFALERNKQVEKELKERAEEWARIQKEKQEAELQRNNENTQSLEKERKEKIELEKLKKGAKFGLAEISLEDLSGDEDASAIEMCKQRLERLREECFEMLNCLEKPATLLGLKNGNYLKVGEENERLKKTVDVKNYKKLLNNVLGKAKRNFETYLADVGGLTNQRLEELEGILDREIKGAKKFVNSNKKLYKMFWLTVEELVGEQNITKPMKLLKKGQKMDSSGLLQGEYKIEYEQILKKIEPKSPGGDPDPLLELNTRQGKILAHFWVVDQKIKTYTNKMGKDRLEIVENKFNNSIGNFYKNFNEVLNKTGLASLWSQITDATVAYKEEKNKQEEEKKRRQEKSKTISGISGLSSSANKSSIRSDSSRATSDDNITSVKNNDIDGLKKNPKNANGPGKRILDESTSQSGVHSGTRNSRTNSGTSGTPGDETESTVYKRVKSIKSAGGQSQNEYEKENETDDDDDLFVDEKSPARHYSDADA